MTFCFSTWIIAPQITLDRFDGTIPKTIRVSVCLRTHLLLHCCDSLLFASLNYFAVCSVRMLINFIIIFSPPITMQVKLSFRFMLFAHLFQRAYGSRVRDPWTRHTVFSSKMYEYYYSLLDNVVGLFYEIKGRNGGVAQPPSVSPTAVLHVSLCSS